MKEILDLSIKLFGKLILISVMCFFLVVSMSVLSTALFTKEEGYVAYGVLTEAEEQNEAESENGDKSVPNNESQELYTHYYKDGQDTKMSEFEAQGYKVSKTTFRSEISAVGNNVFLIITQIINFSILVMFIYPSFWTKGTKDSNLVSFKHKRSDILKGVKAGFLAIIPSILFYIYIFTTKNSASAELSANIFKFLNAPYYSVCEILFKDAGRLADISILHLFIVFSLCLSIPLISGIGYYLGFKNISLGEKLIYKK